MVKIVSLKLQPHVRQLGSVDSTNRTSTHRTVQNELTSHFRVQDKFKAPFDNVSI